MALLVELEEIDVFVIPVIDPVAEVDAVIRITRSPHVDVDKVARAGNIGKEVGVCCQRLHDRLTFLILTVVNLHRIGIFVSSGIDAETEQGMIAHTPELLLLRTALHSRRGQHGLDFFYFHLVTVDVAVLHLTPIQLINDLCGGNMRNVIHVLSII